MKVMGKGDGLSFFTVHALTLYSSPYDSDIAVLFEKNMENIKKIRSFHLRPGGPKHSLAPPLIVLGVGGGVMAQLAPLDPPLML